MVPVKPSSRIQPQKVVRKVLVIPEDLSVQLEAIAEQSGESSADIVRKAIALYIVAHEKKRGGLRVGFARQGQPLETEVIGY